MNPVERANRTWLCTVVFTDIVGYSKLPNNKQSALKERFNRHLSEAICQIAAHEMVIIDTGDGAALCFLGDPEEALFAALAMQTAFSNDPGNTEHFLDVRIGINLGPVKLVKDLNGNLNAIGDGINVAQRVMSFATTNQILVSRSFFEVVSCLSDEYHKLFTFEGTRADKHVREHSIYALATPNRGGAAAPSSSPAVVEITPPAEPINSWPPESLQKLEALLAHSIGPLAKLLIKNATPKSQSWEILCARLGEHIPEEAERARFLAASRELTALAGSIPMIERPSGSQVTPSPAPVHSWPKETLDKLALELAVYLGPMAKILVKKAAPKVSDLAPLYDLLAEQITVPAEKEKFLKSKPGA